MRTSMAIALALGLLACGGEAPSPTPTSTSPPASTPAPVPSPTIARADVDVLLAEWARAQNENDFDAYAGLYDARFVGVRRTPRASFRLDHDGWITDRRRLFTRPMRVWASQPAVVVVATTAIVHFTQRWESGAYAEEGEKRMVLTRTDDGLRITSEEMMTPHTVPPGSDAAPTIAPAFDTPTQTIVVLGETRDAGTGTTRELEATGMYVALRDAGDAIPHALAALVGTHVQLIGEHGTCVATVSALGNAATVVPSFDTEMVWRGGDFGDGTIHPAEPRDRVAADVERMAEHHFWVAIARPSSCGSVRAAVLGERAPVVWPLVARAATDRAVLASIFAGDVRQSLLSDARETSAQPLDDVDDAALEARLRAATTIREHAYAGRPSVIEAIVHLDGPCGGEEQVFRFARDGDTLVPRVIEGFDHVEEVVDVEDDGVPELIMRDRYGDRRILRLDTPATELARWTLSVFGCDC